MRNRWLALLAVLLFATLAGAWYALAPGNVLPALQEDAARGTAAGSLDSIARTSEQDNTEQPATAPATEGETGEESAGPARTRQPARDDQPPTGEVRGTSQPEATSPARTGESTGAGEAPASPGADTPPVQRFIGGHTRPAHQNLGNTRPRAVKLPGKGVKAPGEVSEQLKQDRRGLYAQYFNLSDGKLPEKLPDNPSYTRIDRQVYFPDAESFAGVPVGESFAAVWTGFLVIERADDYWLFWGADNGGRVELAGQTVLLQDGMVRYVEVSTVLTLDAGVYPLRIEFAQFNNGVQDWKKTAACLMWVPTGESKPVPVPPEMLLVPEWMWSDHAPIITGLSKSAGEIGDEITIEGKNFKDPWTQEQSRYAYSREVTFAGQRTRILSEGDTEIRVRVPIGAQTGDVIVRQTIWETRDKELVKLGEIPSNSMPFKVTTQFGLLAEWFELQVGDPRDESALDAIKGREPVRSGVELTLDISSSPDVSKHYVVVWTGKLGLRDWPWSDDVDPTTQMRFHFESSGPIRIWLAGESNSSKKTHGFAGNPTYFGDFWRGADERGYIDIRVEVVCPNLKEMELGGGPAIWGIALFAASKTKETEQYAWWLDPATSYIPPQQPKAPPVVRSVANAAPDPWKAPLALPAPSRPSVAIGETMNVTVQLSTSQLLSPVTFALDGVAMPAAFVESKDVLGNWHVTYSMTVPAGAGEGKLTATQGDSTSEPYLIDIANRGLIGIYYDFPQPGGLSAVPELAALECFALRKDRLVRFESVADFDLPFPAETFVVEWYSALIVEVEGDYVFTGRTDDGMRLWINNELVIDANRLQAPAENSSAPVHLKPGVYPLRMQYFENNQHEVCVLEWRATDADDNVVLPREVIPAKAYSLDALPALPAKQATGKRTDGS